VNAQAKKPNILVVFGDDIGQTDISAYGLGAVGYKTPNIDHIAREGMMFTDYYAENSCTAGRSSFITGQTPKRGGMSKVGIPGASIGLQARDVTMAHALKPIGYATGQFGKNHLGDRNLLTVHGFDMFYGNLNQLNAEEEPERVYCQKSDAAYTSANSPRGVLRCTATDKDDPTEQPHWGRVGKQVCKDTGPLTSKRMETIDDETTAAAIDFMNSQAKAGKPFFVWMNTTRMHVFTHVRPSMIGQSGEDWKAVFCQMKEPGGFRVWYEPSDCLRIPKLFNLRMDPYERADVVSDQYDDWRVKNAFLMGWMTFHAAGFLDTFVEYPPSQAPRVSQSIKSRRKSSARLEPWPRHQRLNSI
jgi:arylsulfatase A-like enzyme